VIDLFIDIVLRSSISYDYVFGRLLHLLLHEIDIQGVPGECARLRENVPYVKIHRYNPRIYIQI
jgi:hypothetical protein